MKEPVIAEIAVAPLGTASTSLSRYVAACHHVLQEATDIRYELSAMGTIVQGPLDRVLAVAQQMHEVPFTMGAQRVLTTIKIDDRRDKHATIESKIAAVQSANRSR
ncbi:MTH1187 family thiamine-binding protein [Chloroflexota bacterium]